MGSKYQRSVRGCLPPWILTLEVILFLVFFFFTSYDTSSKAQKEFLGTYQGEYPEGRWSPRRIVGIGEEEVCGPLGP